MKIKDLFKELLAICVLVPLLHNFCSADSVFESYVQEQNIMVQNVVNLNNSSYTNLFNYNNSNGTEMLTGAGTYCIMFSSTSPQTLTMGFANGSTTTPSNLYTLYNDQYGQFVCLYGNKPYLNAKLNSSTNSVSVAVFNLEQLLNTELQTCKTGYTVIRRDMENSNNRPSRTYDINLVDTIYLQHYTSDGYYSVGNIDMNYYSRRMNENIRIKKANINQNYCESNNLCPSSSSCDTGAILSGYILESSINQSYCVNNGLCPSCPIIDEEYCINNFNLISPSSCPVCSGGVSNWSSLWINNIQHLGASNIYMSIPEEISRDYSYSNSGEIMEVDVEGYNVDYDYINNVVEIQKYKPSDEDFNNIVGILAQYMPIIVIFIGLLFLYKLLKKPFKSKL